MRKVLLLLLLCMGWEMIAPAQDVTTYLYARKDTADLYLDIYEPVSGSEMSVDGIEKPTILFAFGGGFITGTRNDKFYLPWFHALNEAGYRVVSIDYRLGLVGVKHMGVLKANKLAEAIYMAEDDMLTATAWLIRYGDQLGINADNIVLAGSSAGAITALQTVFETTNGTYRTRMLPEGYRYAGVMSFSGAIYTTHGKLKFMTKPCPTLLFHGTKDSLVPYSQIKVLNVGFFGSNKIAERYRKFGYDYRFYRYTDHYHEVASSMPRTVDKQFDFLENVVCRRQKGIIDEYVDDPEMEYWKGTAKDLYK